MNNKLYGFVQDLISAFEKKNGITDMWKPPLVCAIPSDHQGIGLLRQVVSRDHLLPADLIKDAKSIIILFVPFSDRIPKSNLEGETASEIWARAYITTNQLLDHINSELARDFKNNGFEAETIKATNNFNEETLMSRWSHRHFAVMAGLGTFGKNNMLITAQGCCGRLTSLVTNVPLPELGFPVIDTAAKEEKCLNKRNGSCGICQKKCPVNAYSGEGNFDRFKCHELCRKNATLYKQFGLAEVCGKCVAGLPCTSKEP